MTHPEAITKVTCPACTPATKAHCKLCAGDGMVSPEVVRLYKARRSGEYRLTIEPTEEKDT